MIKKIDITDEKKDKLLEEVAAIILGSVYTNEKQRLNAIRKKLEGAIENENKPSTN